MSANNPALDQAGKRFGMWLFLYTEIMLFGGLFLLYAAYYHKYPQDFIENGQHLDTVIGTVNTLLLLVSSFTVAASITAIQRGSKKLGMAFLSGSVLLGLIFLVNKYFEWSHKFSAGIYPGSEELEFGEPGRNIFYGLYYVITGLHGLHVFIGIILLSACLGLVGKNVIRTDRHTLLENCGLYWHLVDLIWIFVFPLFYLVI